MALHQYIGARYVPKFYENSQGTSEWESGVIYEPLTIVTWNGNSYTSKKPVPANIGSPSLNPSYWVATGVFNQQLADISDRVDDLERVTAGIGEPPVNIMTLGLRMTARKMYRRSSISIRLHTLSIFLLDDIVSTLSAL